ncbi:MAG: polysaccharide deacetylase family protein [Kiritimatiellae bacterium]|nr:polysaccharide deacetylase family protein [Kiritimatiellia bacterium]
MSIRIMLGFDMETDVGSFTPFYHGLAKGTPVILDILSRQKVTGTCFFTGDSAKQHPEVAAAVKAAGHEIGCHTLFHETIGDDLFPIPGLRPVLPEEVPHRLDLATRWVQEAAGVRPVSFRAPRLFGSTAMINALNDLGYVADASYPMYFYKERLEPYHPSRADWTKPGDLSILELPNFADMAMPSNDPYGRDRDQWPLFRTEGVDALMRHVDGFVGFCGKAGVEPFLCFYFHPWEFYEMPQGEFHFGEAAVRPDAFITKNCGAVAAREFEALIVRLKRMGGRFLQARQVAAEVER